MATLVLTAVGTLIGGPIGGAIGSIFGQQIDQSLFAPKARQGPRLGSLAIQTSSYGTDIPKIFGTMRVAGTVIWASDLIESRATSGGGKGRPKTVSFSYAANFAVALSGRRVLSVRRIWADGKLLRGVAGDFKTPTRYRLHTGGEDQNVDPLIASAEGANAPAFRGVAYAVFENFQLEDYGNRIPSLTFEVQADPGDVPVAAIARALVHRPIEGDGPEAIAGYAASGDSVRAAISPLVDVFPIPLSDRESGLTIGPGAGSPAAVPGHIQLAKPQITRLAATNIPAEVAIAYYDTARDFQTGTQRAADAGTAFSKARRTALPAALSPTHAKQMAEAQLERLRAERLEAKIVTSCRAAHLRPGQFLAVNGVPGLLRVRRWTLGPGNVTIELVRCPSGDGAHLPAAEPGGGAFEPDVVHGPTTIRLLDMPLGEPGGGRPLLLAAAAGSAPGWRRASVLASFDGGASWQDAGPTAPPAVLGLAATILAASGVVLFDLAESVDIDLLSAGMWIENAEDTALADGANLAALGDELIQFGRAEHLGGRRFRLSRLLRGRRGTEWAMTGHEAGEPFVLIEHATTMAIEAPAGSIGGAARVSASGVGDEMPALALTPITGSSLQPPSPVHLRAIRSADGDLTVHWTRRSRLGWSWTDGNEVPLGEEKEAYLLTVSGAGGSQAFALDAPSFVYPAAAQVADLLSGPVTIEVVQLGTHARSRPAILDVD